MPAARTKASFAAFSGSLQASVQEALDRASDLSAVERFSQWHQGVGEPAHQALYRDLVPLSAPGFGQQYSFEVDLDKCSGCKACVVACHSLNGLDDGESWRTTGTLLGEKANLTVTTSCHHCVDPGCANGCPTLAYEKDSLTGIVKHLDDQCMGCQYCLWTCPYDAPKWNARLGIVRKCDLCQDRLAVGEAPACVQSCPSQAIRVVVVESAALLADATRGTVLPGISAPERTRPTTVYVGHLDADLVSGAASCLDPEHAHTPLAILLVLTQWATGLWILELVCWAIGGVANRASFPVATGLLLAGLLLGSLHLGRPTRAWKAFLGWRRSWFSREVLAMGTAVPLALIASLPVAWLPAWGSWSAMLFAAGFLGLGVGCSAMLYIATPRPAWARAETAWRFALTAIGGGAVLLAALGSESTWWLLGVGLIAGVVKNWLLLRDCRAASSGVPAMAQQARLLRGPLAGQVKAQFGWFTAFVVMAGLGAVLSSWPLLVAAALFRIASDLVERRLFFQACPPTRMPGGL